MDKLTVTGGRRLEGQLRVHGSKNAVLPVIAATVLNGGKNVIRNCPNIKDVYSSIEILRYLGCEAELKDNVLTVDSTQMTGDTIAEELMRKMRSSIIFMGAILSRCGKAKISMPGGCEIGLRPIDLHMRALKQMGVKISESHGYIHCSADKLSAEEIHLEFPSVGATENIMLASVFVKGSTIITNAAREPEIVDLQDCLNAMGARVSGAGGSVIRIDGVEKLHDVQYTVMPDRIVAGTYLVCAAITKGSVIVDGVRPEHIEAMLSVLREMGSSVYVSTNSVVCIPGKTIKPADYIRTMPYPGFPTDIQAPFMALASVAQGTTIFAENIFESRYKHVQELLRMGADIKTDGRVAVVRGVNKLTGANVAAGDLRGGAALVAAALAAEGVSEIGNVEYIDRGYENIEKNLSLLGAKIKRVKS